MLMAAMIENATCAGVTVMVAIRLFPKQLIMRASALHKGDDAVDFPDEEPVSRITDVAFVATFPDAI